MGVSGYRLIIGRIVLFYVNDEILVDEFKIDFLRFNPLGRVAGSLYCKLNDFLEIPRLNCEKYKNQQNPWALF